MSTIKAKVNLPHKCIEFFKYEYDGSYDWDDWDEDGLTVTLDMYEMNGMTLTFFKDDLQDYYEDDEGWSWEDSWLDIIPKYKDTIPFNVSLFKDNIVTYKGKQLYYINKTVLITQYNKLVKKKNLEKIKVSIIPIVKGK